MNNPAAWHPDPTGRHEHRWWDGEQWTEHVADAGQSSVDPLEGTGTAAAADDHGTGLGSAGDTTAGHTGADDPAASSEGQTGGDPAQHGSWEQPDAQQPGAAESGWGQPAGEQPGAQAGWTPSGTDQPQAGWPQQQGWPQSAPVAQSAPAKTPGTAITALILGIVGIILFCIPILGAPLAILAVVLGFIGRSQAQKRGAGGGGLALAGIITGGIGVVVNLLMLYFIFVVIGGIGAFFDYAECVSETNDMEYCEEQLERRLGVR